MKQKMFCYSCVCLNICTLKNKTQKTLELTKLHHLSNFVCSRCTEPP